MKTVKKSVLIWYSPPEMYALVTDVARYPEFLPWCDRAQVLDQNAAGMTAEVGIAFAGMHQTFTTRNTHTPPSKVDMQLVQGPFSHLDGQWQFQSVGDGSQRACKVELSLNYGFKGALGAVLGPVFDKIAASMVDAFVKRAQKVYGDSGER
jgi:ribosome-associated toxin RatA of RatAB toxin-antitoxin module